MNEQQRVRYIQLRNQLFTTEGANLDPTTRSRLMEEFRALANLEYPIPNY